MSKIKDWWENRKAKQKFKAAGPAHRLADSNSPDHGQGSSSMSNQPSNQRSRNEAELSAAAAAAMERKQQQEQQKKTDLNWSSRAIKNQARQELESENAMKETTVPQTRQVLTVNEDCANLTVSGVYYTCPIIGPEVLPKSEVKSKIRSFLYEQLEQEKGLTACLMIHTLNQNKDKVKIGIDTLLKYLTNIIDKPTEDKYRKIRIGNKVFQERIVDLEGAFEFLEAAGFSREYLKIGNEMEEEYLILKDRDFDVELLQMLKEAIESAEPILPVLDRNLKVLKPADYAEKVVLPEAFYNLTIDELKKQQEERTEITEALTQLRTKEMREKDALRERHKYKFSLIRIRFPDGIILQGTFHAYEKIQKVKEFVAENLSSSVGEFELLLPGGTKITNDNQSLLDLKLVPAVVLNFQVSGETDASSPDVFLNPECMSLLSDL